MFAFKRRSKGKMPSRENPTSEVALGEEGIYVEAERRMSIPLPSGNPMAVNIMARGSPNSELAEAPTELAKEGAQGGEASRAGGKQWRRMWGSVLRHNKLESQNDRKSPNDEQQETAATEGDAAVLVSMSSPQKVGQTTPGGAAYGASQNSDPQEEKVGEPNLFMSAVKQDAESVVRDALAYPSPCRLKSALDLAADAGLTDEPCVDSAKAALERAARLALSDFERALVSGDASGVAQAMFAAGPFLEPKQWSEGRARYLQLKMQVVGLGRGLECLNTAVSKGELDAVFEMALQAGVRDLGRVGGYPLAVAAERGHLEIVAALVQAGANVNFSRDGDGASPLYMASQNAHVKVVQGLVQAGANLDQARIDDGSTPLLIASQQGHRDVVRVLLEAGADANKAMATGVTPLLMASCNDHCEVVKMLLQAKANVHQCRINDGMSPLLMSSLSGCLEVVKELLDGGACVDSTKASGATPLFLACYNGHADVARALVLAGANMNCARTDGVAPLVIAACNGHVEVVRYLLESGVDRWAKSAKWGTAAEAAHRKGHTEVAALFQ